MAAGSADVSRRPFVHKFHDAPADDTGLLGGKGAGLARMTQAGLRVPKGFVITTDAFRAYHSGNRQLPQGMMDEVWASIAGLEHETEKRFAQPGGVPLLLSVRSGSKVSMPGMMDTVLNLGLDSAGLARLAEAADNREFAIQTYLRFWRMYAEIVCGVHPEVIDEARRAIADAEEGDFTALENSILESLKAEGATVVPDPRGQLRDVIAAVFDSWQSSRAVTYRRYHGIPDELGTAVVVQAMVFGNLGHPSGSGVCFTRDPLTGENRLYGEYLEGGQGEEVVAGTRTPAKIDQLRQQEPELVASLEDSRRRLERLYLDALDIEFTIERGVLYLLQVRTAKRTAAAAVRVATELVREGVIDGAEAVRRMTPDQIQHLMRPEFSRAARAAAEAQGARVAKGIGASPGQASGAAVLDSDRAAEMAAAGTEVILVRPTTSPQDLRGMLAARGIVTALGGATSHAAVVARALDKPCVTGCADLVVDSEGRVITAGDRSIEEGSPLSIDGEKGDVYAGVIATETRDEVSGELDSLLRIADELSGCAVWASVASQEQVGNARLQGARGLVLSLGEVLAASDSSSIRELVELVGSGLPADAAIRHLEVSVAERLQAVISKSEQLPVLVLLLDLDSSRDLVMLGVTSEQVPDGLRMPQAMPELIGAQMRGITTALSGRVEVTAVASGLPPARVLRALASEAGMGATPLGLLVQDSATAQDTSALVEAAGRIWVDLPELVRTVLGCSAEVFESEEFVRSQRPLASVDGRVGDLLSALAGQAGGAARLGIMLGSASEPGLIEGLHAAGHRLFGTGIKRLAPLRLQLAQTSRALEGVGG